MRRIAPGKPKGQAVIEVALLSPWIFLLFAGVFDFGFYCFAAICTANAARAAALQTSASPASAGDSAVACQTALQELRALPNVGTAVTGCAALPVQVAAAAATGPDGAPSTRVAVTYQSVQLFRIPGLMDRMTLTRVAEMRVQRE